MWDIEFDNFKLISKDQDSQRDDNLQNSVTFDMLVVHQKFVPD